MISSFSDGGYPRLLDRVYDSKHIGGVARWGIHAKYGEFRQWVTNLPSGTALKSALDEGLRKHAQARGIIISKKTRDAENRRVDVGRLTLVEAANACKVSHLRLKEAATKLGYLKYETGSGQPVELTPQQVKEISVHLKGRITMKKLAYQLGIERHTVDRMRRAGTILSFADELGLDIEAQGSLLATSFSAGTADQLMADLEETLAGGVEQDFSAVPEAAKNLRCSTAKIVSYIKSGKLNVRAFDEYAHGLWRFMISRKELRRVDANSDPNGRSLRQAARELMFNYGMLSEMHKAGLVSVEFNIGSYTIVECH